MTASVIRCNGNTGNAAGPTAATSCPTVIVPAIANRPPSQAMTTTNSALMASVADSYDPA